MAQETAVGLSGLQKYHFVPRTKEQAELAVLVDQRQNLPT